MDPDFDRKFELLRQQHADGLVVGLEELTGDVVARQDVDVLMRDEPRTFNLFIQAYKQFLELDCKHIMSHWQLSGIHGYPKVLWNNVEGKDMDPDSTNGYCAHSRTIFPPWHRPYLVMIEQAIFIEMVNVARKYDPPYRDEYLLATLKFRLPYWDYYRPRGGPVSFPGVIHEGNWIRAPYDFSVPKIFTQAKITVRVPPQNTLLELDPNPFQSYIFDPKSGRAISEADWEVHGNPVLSHRRTVRYPRAGDPTFEQDNYPRMNHVMNELRIDYTRYMLAIMDEDYYNDYENFSNRWSGEIIDGVRQLKKTGSIEGWHDNYHAMIGWDGHFSDVAIAAFEPLFWFHHNNIERIFTIWQAVHAGKDKNWFARPDEAAAPLLPFYQSKGNFWTSNDVRDWTIFGYTYEEVKSTPEKTKAFFCDKYQWSVPMRESSDWGPCPPEMRVIDVMDLDFFKAPSSPLSRVLRPALTMVSAVAEYARNSLRQTAVPPALEALVKEQLAPKPMIGEDEETYDWYIDDSVERMALNGPFSILYYLDKEPGQRFENDKPMFPAPTLAGINHIFSLPEKSCANCRKQAANRHRVSNTTPITSKLLDFVRIGELQDLSPANVVPFLVDRLHWCIVQSGGRVVSSSMMGSQKQFQVGISAVRHTGMPHSSSSTREVMIYDDDVIPHVLGRAPSYSLEAPQTSHRTNRGIRRYLLPCCS